MQESWRELLLLCPAALWWGLIYSVRGSSACVHMDSQLRPATGAGKCVCCRELVVLREEMVGNEGSSASLHSVCLHRRRSKLLLWKSVMQRQEPACSQLPRKLKRSLSFAAHYLNVKWVKSCARWLENVWVASVTNSVVGNWCDCSWMQGRSLRGNYAS